MTSLLLCWTMTSLLLGTIKNNSFFSILKVAKPNETFDLVQITDKFMTMSRTGTEGEVYFFDLDSGKLLQTTISDHEIN
jgi:hypothetical protein